jgi:hypothetical protein
MNIETSKTQRLIVNAILKITELIVDWYRQWWIKKGDAIASHMSIMDVNLIMKVFLGSNMINKKRK